jgi:hypothetical protein
MTISKDQRTYTPSDMTGVINLQMDRPTFDPKAKPIGIPDGERNRVLEVGIERDIVSYLKTLPGCMQWKDGQNGRPDRWVCYYGLLIGLEVKRPGNTMTTLQKVWQQKVRDAGGIHAAVYSVDDVKSIIERLNRHFKLNGRPKHKGASVIERVSPDGATYMQGKLSDVNERNALSDGLRAGDEAPEPEGD